MWRIIISLCILSASAFFIDHSPNTTKHELCVENFRLFLKDLAFSLQTSTFTIVFGTSDETSEFDAADLNEILKWEQVATVLFLGNETYVAESYFTYMLRLTENSLDSTTIFICHTLNCEMFLKTIKSKNLIRRTLLYMFYWGNIEINKKFTDSIYDGMRVAVITVPRESVFRIYYNQASSYQERPLELVNWWSGRMYRSPALPSSAKVFNDLNGRVFKVPVLHAPPWHFVTLYNDSAIEVVGGRDDQLLKLLAEKLNFKYKYFDPPQHSQGSGKSSNGSFKGVLGMIYRREADFFLGDVTMNWGRQQGVEFSFFTLADSGAFLTHAPRRLSEALALLRPFRWEVWPAVLGCILISGPAFWAAAAGPALWRPHRAPIPPSLNRCVWFTISVFFCQSNHIPSNAARARFLAIIFSLAAAYVLGDVYSATLTSLLARPGREPPITDIFALENAVRYKGYSLYVEKHSSSLVILQNGTGVYKKLWNLMQRQQSFAVRSVEQGVRKMLQNPGNRMVLLAGRETLYFDSRRFGASSFQLSEKLYTKYSSIALQLGCPYAENFNRVLMQLFEAGILTKITSEEYEKLGESGIEGSAPSGSAATSPKQDGTSIPTLQSTQKLEPISMRMLQGAFYVLIFGYGLSGLTLIFEIMYHRRSKSNKKLGLGLPNFTQRIKNRTTIFISRIRRWTRRRWRRAVELSELSLEFIH